MNVQNEKKAVHTSKIHLVTMHYRGWYNACFIFSDETVGLNRQTCCEPVDGKSTNIVLYTYLIQGGENSSCGKV